MDVNEVITIDPEIQFGTPVFKGTRVPVISFFQHLESGVTIDNFILDFPTVKKEQCIALLELSEKIVTSKNFKQLYETAA